MTMFWYKENNSALKTKKHLNFCWTSFLHSLKIIYFLKYFRNHSSDVKSCFLYFSLQNFEQKITRIYWSIFLGQILQLVTSWKLKTFVQISMKISLSNFRLVGLLLLTNLLRQGTLVLPFCLVLLLVYIFLFT